MSFTPPSSLPDHVPVLVAGGGPVGLTTAALLASYGIDVLVIEADEGYCTGSRAICMARRSLEILDWVGAGRPVLDKGLGWTAGRSYFRDREVLRFEMPHDPTQRFDPMVNIQQYYVEAYAHEAAQRQDERVQVAWGCKVGAIRQDAAGVDVTLATPQGERRVRADWLVACDGGRSTVREQLGLAFTGMQYEGRYVIVDIEQDSRRPTERLAWFDPPSNPGSTILMHRQPDNVWRIDYQIGEDEDADEAVKPENVLPRVQSHLDMIGETAPWKPLWISIYNAKCLTLERYRHGRVLFAGDAGHLVPIFGVRGLNSGLDDAGNLAWKLAWVMRGAAPDSLLDTFSEERVHATRQNIAYGAKSTEFMAPPSHGFALMREAALRLALDDEAVRPLINPRQSSPISYDGSALNGADALPEAGAACAPGMPAPELQLGRDGRTSHLSQAFGRGFVLLAVDCPMATQAMLAAACATVADGTQVPAPRLVAAQGPGGDDPRAWRIAPGNEGRYGRAGPAVFLVRPDGYVLGRWPAAQADEAVAALAGFHPQAA
ncbi:FAD-dependent oxidoreductase [Verticiella sediminum]|uniref:FAD-dependent oxidoreductase n=1 Tax=Verticiella sediminum TaxID=1247510 RepID=A0A556B279_9BURK|nr:FAD-dependent oxidoreductase [Verticiella sediminum]TSH99263.1 FAD-dependent oxidoreductase [Verticiella sediminum]